MKPKTQGRVAYKSTKEFKAEQTQAWKDHIVQLKEHGMLSDRTYMSHSEARVAYEFVLNTGEKAMPALNHVAKEKGKPSNWIDDVKASPIGKQLLIAVMRDTAKHPTVGVMTTYNLTNTNYKRAIKEARSISSALNTLSDHVNIANRLYFLENRVGFLESMMVSLTAKVEDTSQRIDEISRGGNTNITLGRLTGKQEARRLVDVGLTQREIAEKLSKSQKTISNWLKGS